MGKPDPLATALDAITAGSSGGTEGKIVQLFGDRPDVLEAITRARRDRKLSFRQIATALSTEDGVSVSEGAVQNWLAKQGIR